jgi:RimJ/RimL family protein N-acetyltransferase
MINIQPILESENLILKPINNHDFEALYQVASDAKIWEQHPSKDRWQKDVFKDFFDFAIQSRGALKIIDKATNEILGSSRFYDFNKSENSIIVGYTFYATKCWGTGINLAVKKMMLDYIFQFVEQVDFQIGTENIRSQIAIGRIGAKKLENPDLPFFVYRLSRTDWK